MNQSDYTDLALTGWKLLPSNSLNLLHVAVGFTGELLELAEATSRENLLEELSDANYYLTIGSHFFPTSPDNFSTPWPRTATEQTSRLFSLANQLLDYAKKAAVYNQHIPSFIIGETIATAQICLEGHTLFLGFDPQDLIDYSAAKVKKRYPDGYSDEAAALRADKVR